MAASRLLFNPMVNHQLLNQTFHALADPTRRQIIGMLTEQRQHRITELAEPFPISLVAVSKHIKVLERAELVTRFKRGREFYLQLNPEPLRRAKDWLAFYEKFWLERFANLEELLNTEQSKNGEENQK